MGTSDGRIFEITPQADGVNFNKRMAFSLGVTTPITALVADGAVKTICLATGNGLVVCLLPMDEASQADWEPISKEDFERDLKSDDVPALTADLLVRG